MRYALDVPTASAQNRDENAKPVRGRPFTVGNNANPGGRPKGLATKIREIAPPDQLAEYFLAIWTKDTTALRRLKIKVADVTLAERTKAADWLADRGYGKAPQFALVEGDPLELDAIDASIAAVLDDLAARRETKAAREGAPGAVAATG